MDFLKWNAGILLIIWVKQERLIEIKFIRIHFQGIKKTIQTSELIEFTQLALEYIDQSIRVNKRKDGLYHAYNLISLNDNGVTIRHLYEMLEGQVAVLSAGYFNPQRKS